MSKQQRPDALACRRNKVGGEAVLEGVMMKAGERYCVATRTEDGAIRLKENRFESVRKRHKALNIPVLRGIVNFVEMMMLSYKSLNISAEALGIEEEDSKAEKWLREKFGRGIMDVVMVIGMVLGLALGFGLFFFLPMLTTKAMDNALGGNLGLWKNVIEGVLRICIFILYILLVSLMPDIRRTFEYHGSEHKSIFCYESGEPLTVENVKKQKRFHPRCGTSFIFVILILSIIVFSFVTWDNIYIRLCLKLPLLPVIVGVGYEFIMYAGKHENLLTKILSAPGLWMQRITTREPDDAQIEVAIASLKYALRDEYPDFAVTEVPGKDYVLAGENALPEEKNGESDAFTEEGKAADSGEAPSGNLADDMRDAAAKTADEAAEMQANGSDMQDEEKA